MPAKTVLLVLTSALSLAGGAAVAAAPAVDWSGIYSAGDLPDAGGWSVSKGANTTAEVTPDGLVIRDSGTAKGELHCYSRNWHARPELGALARVQLRVVSCSGQSGMCLLVADGVHEAGVTFYLDRIEIAEPAAVHPMATVDGFHTYEVRIRGNDLELSIDGGAVVTGVGNFSKPAHQGRNTIMFGSISSAATGEAVWREVRYAAFVPPVVRPGGARDVVIYRQDGVYACFPSLFRLADGRLFTGFGTRSRRSHIDPTGGSARAASPDGGESWSLTTETPANPAFVRADGTTFVPHAQGWVYVDEKELPKVKDTGRTWRQVKPGQIAYLGDPKVSVTAPDGTKRTVELPNPAVGGVMGYHAEASFGRSGKVWLRFVYGGATSADGADGVWAIRSEDDGQTWQVVPVAVPATGEKGLNESAVCENGRGEWVAVMRPEDETRNSYQCFSSDGGRTWSPAQDAGFWGYPSHLLRLQDGRLLCTRGYRRDAMGIRAVLSRDGGHSWDLANEIIIRADGKGSGSDNGYPISVQLADGHLFTIYYLNDAENVTHIAGTHWPLPELH